MIITIPGVIEAEYPQSIQIDISKPYKIVKDTPSYTLVYSNHFRSPLNGNPHYDPLRGMREWSVNLSYSDTINFINNAKFEKKFLKQVKGK